MALIKFGNEKSFGSKANGLVAQVKAARSAQGTENTSFESVISGGSETAYALVHGIAGSESFESATGMKGLADAEQHNPVGVASMAMVAGVLQSKNGQSWMEALSTESVNLHGEADSVATSYGVEYPALSMESFDNQVLNDFADVSIALAYTTGVQSPGLERIYRTVALTPEQGGYDLKVPMLFTQNMLVHAADGSPSNFGFRRLQDADIDHRILENNVTRIIPMVTSSNANLFVSPSQVAHWPEVSGTREVETSALKVDEDINLFGIGSLDLASRAGQPNYTEALDRNIGLEHLFLNLGNDTLKVTVKGIPFSRFIKSSEQGGKKLTLNFPASTILVDGNTVAYNGEELEGQVFSNIKSLGYTVRLAVTVNGEVDLERGVVSVHTGGVKVRSIRNEQGDLVALDDSTASAIVGALNNRITVIGFTLEAYLTNSNNRHLGLMMNVRHVTERLLTRTRSPIWMPLPAGEDRDERILDYLTVAVQKQKEKDGITQLIAYHENLMAQTGGLRGDLVPGDFEQNALPYEGIGRYVLNGYCETVVVDLDTTQALDTNSKVKNAKTTFLNTLRSVFFDIMQRTNYENAARFVDGGQIKHKYEATLFGTDTLQRFMTIEGDSRTLGADVPHQIYSTVDGRLKDRANDVDTMYMVFTRDSDGLDPLTAGVMLNTPSLVSVLTTTRGGAHNKEVVVQPRYAHYNLCPIIVKFEVKGVHKLLEETLPFKAKVNCCPQAPGNGGEAPGNGGEGDGEEGGDNGSQG